MVLIRDQFVNLRDFHNFIHINSEIISKNKGIIYYKLPQSMAIKLWNRGLARAKRSVGERKETSG